MPKVSNIVVLVFLVMYVRVQVQQIRLNCVKMFVSQFTKYF